MIDTIDILDKESNMSTSIPNNNITHALGATTTTSLADQINLLRKEASNLEATARRYAFIKFYF